MPKSDKDVTRTGADIAGVDAAVLVEAAFRRARVGMAITDGSGQILEVNDELCSLLGHRAPELRAMSFHDLMLADDLHDVDALTRLAAGTSEIVVDERYVAVGADRVRVRLTATAVRANGDLRRVIIQFEDLSEHQALAAALSRSESYDDLTGLANRRLFYEHLGVALAQRRRPSRRLAVLIVNLNRFQQINAGLGHLAADLVLIEVGRRITEMTRRGDTVARLGGDWFALLAQGVTTTDEAVALAIAIRHRLSEPYWAAGNATVVSARVGVTTAPTDGADAVTLVRVATSASNLAKTQSSGWAVPVIGADRHVRDELALVGDLRDAIDNGDLTVAYQPIVDGEGRVHSLEVLARWHHPIRGQVPPDQFIIWAEQHGLIAALTTRVQTSACRQAATWGPGGSPVPVAVNLSGMLLADPNVVEKISGVLASTDFPAEALTLEITETALAVGDSQAIWAQLQALRSAGVRISIDDFGTGYSSLAYLKDLPVDELKIDRSFISTLSVDSRTERIVHSIIDLAHTLDLIAVAEGVESEAVAEQLLELGVDYLQGYVIARPAGAQVVTDWLMKNASSLAPTPARSDGSRALNVLVVDDQLATRAALRKQLRERRHRVVEAHSGSAALERLKRRMPDVIVLDHLLRGTSGVDTVPTLREAGYAGPILLFSGSPPEDLDAIRFPLDVWPVSKADEATLIRLIDGYAGARRSTRSSTAIQAATARKSAGEVPAPAS